MNTKLKYEEIEITKSGRYNIHGRTTLITFHQSTSFYDHSVKIINIEKFEEGWEKKAPANSPIPYEEKIITGISLEELLSSLSSEWIIRRYPHGAAAFYKELHQLYRVTEKWEEIEHCAIFKNYPDFDPRYDKIFNCNYCREE